MARKSVGSYGVAPGVVQYTTDLLFRELWLRPALAPRDRSLVTVSALIASGQSAQVTYHLSRAMDNGVTKAEASEVLTHLPSMPVGRVCFRHYRLSKLCLKSGPTNPAEESQCHTLSSNSGPENRNIRKRILPVGSVS